MCTSRRHHGKSVWVTTSITPPRCARCSTTVGVMHEALITQSPVCAQNDAAPSDRHRLRRHVARHSSQRQKSTKLRSSLSHQRHEASGSDTCARRAIITASAYGLPRRSRHQGVDAAANQSALFGAKPLVTQPPNCARNDANSWRTAQILSIHQRHAASDLTNVHVEASSVQARLACLADPAF